MTKFFTVAAFILLLMMLFLLATNNAGNPAVLSTVEYGINTDAAIADRAAERLHNEEMARIEAQRIRTEETERTNRWLVVGGVAAIAMASTALAMTARKPQAVMLERRPDVYVIESPEKKKIEAR